MPTTRSMLVLLSACATLLWSAEANRVYEEKVEGLSDSLIEARTGADEVDSGSGKTIFEDFFADPASFSKPGAVSGHTSCGMWCSTMGGASKVGEWHFSFGKGMNKIFGSDPNNPVLAYSFNDGNSLVVQWKGTKIQDAEKWAATFGGWSKAQLMVTGEIFDREAEKGAYHISPDLGMGDTAKEVFGKMCAPGGVDDKTHKYAIPMRWDGMRELGWTGFPKELLLKHYYRGSGTHMDLEMLPQADVKVTSCANTAGTDLFKNDPVGSCHTKAELEKLLRDVDEDFENDPTALTDDPKVEMTQRHYDELKQILASPFQEKLVNIHNGKEEVGWTRITEGNVGFVRNILTRSSDGDTAREKVRLAKMKPFQQGLLVLKYTCLPPFSNFDGNYVGQFRFQKISIYLTK